ncbi:MAG: beta galactosidase jelly roll domain-containing protein [Clostridia bacterium]|nr:beta galactosidase jelly roll domain-containing protein [Clostridia bacterium]
MKTVPLNFGWKYSPVFSPEMLVPDFDDSGFESVDIPHCNKELPYNYFDEQSYQFVSCYRKSFDLSKEDLAAGKRVFLQFEGAANYAVVYLNGKEAGSHKGAYTQFTLELTSFVNEGKNTIAVMLDSTERSEIPPFGKVVDYLVYGGIYREVSLIVTENLFIEDVFIRTPRPLSERKTIVADITLNQTGEGLIRAAFCDRDGAEIKSREFAFKGKIINLRWNIGQAELWDVANPALYRLKLTLNGDDYSYRFGFREAEFTKQGFFLNSRHIKLVGLNRHQSYPYVGNAMPASAQIADAEELKYRLGCNFVRTAHYPDSTHFIDRCDEIGLIVFTEMPSWQYLGEGEWRDNCLDNIRSMILRDRNHPSIVLWGVRVNEGADCVEFYTQTNALARSLDPTRQTGGVRNIPFSHLLEDVYTYNDFSHSGSFISLLPPTFVAGSKAPYLVTEHNGHMYPTKSFDNEPVRREHALRHLRVQNRSFGCDRISGATGWCFADYNTHKDFGSGDRICYHGVTDMFRVPKLAAYVYASQQDDFDVMESSSSMDIGDHPGGILGPVYIFTNCDYVKVYKNGELKSVAYPNRKKFPNLPHPPICPVDYIGDSLETEENLDPKAANLLKDALIAAGQYGFLMPPQNYLKAVASMIVGKLTFNDAYDIVTKYFANWGNEQIEYKFEGYRSGRLVKTIVRTAVRSVHYSAAADKTKLVEDNTYDVTRIELLALDQNGNRLPYCCDAATVKVTGAARLIGPERFALIGGDRAFWIRSVGKSGKAKITVSFDKHEPLVLEIDVVKK